MIKVSNKPKAPEAPSLSAQETADRLKEKARVRRKLKIHNVTVKVKATGVGFGELWSLKLREFFPRMILIPTMAEIAMLKRLSKRMQGGDPEYFIELMGWSIQHWSVIMDSAFQRMLNKPQAPSIKFFTACITTFQSLYTERKFTESLAGMTEKERMVMRLQRRGMSKEAAIRQAEERFGVAERREEMKKETARLQLLQNRQQRNEELEERLKLMDTPTEQTQTPKVKGTGGTFEPWK